MTSTFQSHNGLVISVSQWPVISVPKTNLKSGRLVTNGVLFVKDELAVCQPVNQQLKDDVNGTRTL